MRAHVSALAVAAVLLCSGVAHAQLVSVSAGGSHNCGRTQDGQVRCWGLAAMGRLAVPEGRYRQVSAGGGNACGILDDGSLRCWGVTISGIPRTTPREGRYLHVSVGTYAACAIRDDHRLVCWGGDPGLLVQHGSWGREVLQGIPEGAFSQVSVGYSHACALRADGHAVCWGDEDRVSGAPDDSFVALTSAGRHSCGLRRDGLAVCWGTGNVTAPADVRFSAISTGAYALCGVVRGSGALRCFGGSAVSQDVPEGRFVSVAVNPALVDPHACAITAAGATVCWGDRDNRGARPPD